MSLTARIAAAILLLVALTATLSWLVASRLVFRPLVDEVYTAYLHEVAFIGHRIERGADIPQLAEALDLKVTPVRGPPPPHWRAEIVRGRRIFKPPGPRNVLLVETRDGLFQVQRELDLERPGRRLPLAFLSVAVVVMLVAVWIARRGVQPVRVASDAMTRMAGGELDHRLSVSGPPEIRNAADAFNTMADRIAGMLRSEKQLLAGISHELRTPLTRLRLEIELLRDAGADPARLDRMEGDLEQLDDLVGEALELSRLQLGQRPLEREDADLADLAREALERTDLGGRPVTLALAAAPARVDRRLVRRALRNLLANAAKYTPPGTAIEVRSAPGTVEIRDHGPGVPDADLAHLFEPFYRTASGSNRAEGHGLGLMIVQQVMQLHGGRVAAANADPGLSVSLAFPVE
ncbi:MAG: HAMP domain-containing histidine kinase [Alphaproteobacteria bacterium]|nr:HAMP domain-containing histidine kinase [Alphaproteobacteria bacterium]